MAGIPIRDKAQTPIELGHLETMLQRALGKAMFPLNPVDQYSLAL